MVTVVKLAASQRAAKFPAIAILAEAVVDHGHAGKTNRYTVTIDRIITILTLFGLVASIKSDHSADVPKLEQAIDRHGIVGGIATERVNFPVRMQLFELSQSKNAGDAVVAASLKEAKEDGQIAFEILVIDRKNVLRVAIEVIAMVAVPAEAGVRIGKMARTVAIEDTLPATGTLFASPTGTPGQDAGAITRNRQISCIAEQTESGSGFHPYFGKDLLHESLGTIFEGPALGSQVSKFCDNAWPPYWLLLVFGVFLSGFATKEMEFVLKFMLHLRVSTPDTVDQVIIRTDLMDFVSGCITNDCPENGCSRKAGNPSWETGNLTLGHEEERSEQLCLQPGGRAGR